MEWMKIDRDNLINDEVLVANFNKGTYGYKEKLLGYISYVDGSFVCENSNEILEGCTHYIDVNKFDLEE